MVSKFTNFLLILSGSMNIYAAYTIEKQNKLITKQKNALFDLKFKKHDNNIKIAELKIGKDTIYN